MDLSFLPIDVKNAILNLNLNKLFEIRLRTGQPVIVQYCGEYKYLGVNGICSSVKNAIKVDSAEKILYCAVNGNVYSFSEQLKNGFITVENGVRIGVAGEYVTEGNKINAVTGITSLNIRIPHDVYECSAYLFDGAFCNGFTNLLIFSKPGLGKTTMLRDLVRKVSKLGKNVLLFDERNEIAAIYDGKFGFYIGESVDVVRGSNKLYSIKNAIRVFKPDVIVTDELYGDEDINGVAYAVDCGINVIASSHVCNKNKLKTMPFNVYAELTAINNAPIIYDKNFNIICGNSIDDRDGRTAFF